MRGLYVHIPYCVRKCSYCDFYSLPDRLETLDAYIQAVLQEAQKYSRLSFQTIYIGGGTPSLLGAKHFNLLMDGLRDVLSLSNPLESTIEVNPESAKPEFFEAVKNAGFNRISIGVQSLHDSELRTVGRVHTASQAASAIKLATQFNFQSISADLMIGLPGQTSASLHKSLKTTVELGVEHLSVYCLSLEEGTSLANNPPPDLPSDDLQAKLFEETVKYLQSCGFAHYEISNFALPGFECQHNLNYWHGGEYLGLGPAAASHLDGKRFKNRANLDAYLENPTAQIEYVEQLSNREKAAEEAMLRLRLLQEGLDADALAEKFGEQDTEAIVERLDKMVKEGLLLNDGADYRLTPARILTSNPIFARVLG